MPYEFVRRTLNSRIGGSADSRPFVEALTTYLLDVEEKSGSEISYINFPKDNILPFGLSNGENYEAYDWFDPFVHEKKKPADYAPPVIKHREASDPDQKAGWSFSLPSFNFDIFWFCILAVWLGLVAFGGILIWFVW